MHTAYQGGISIASQELSTELIHINAQLTHVRGRIRLDGQIYNNGKHPIEKIKIAACYNRADISSIGPSGDTLHYLLPGQTYEVSIWLEPRASAENIIIGLKVRAKSNGDSIRNTVYLEPFDLKIKGRPYQNDRRYLGL
ncbi:MAG TPA: hypothetical protein EYQ58_01465 [Candidatus Poseidoniales archaeon]|nr:MAG: hypothetical protein CXT70_04600 [Euryarchaeota archaeon]HIF90213.1 hypothetical protein [Candidatus Poseidoniales archaeon]